MIKRYSISIFIFTCLILPLAASAATFNNIVSFGDSTGLWIDGPSWVQHLADADHMNCNSHTWNGGGATTADILNNQVAPYLASYTPDSDTLIAISGGGMDMVFAGDPIQSIVDISMPNIAAALTALADDGARNFMLPSLYTPLQPPVSSSEDLEAIWNNGLAEMLINFETDYEAANGININVYYLDVNSLIDDIIADPGSFGFTNVTEPGYGQEGYLFVDPMHLSTAFSRLEADMAFGMVVPIPSSVWLLGTGFIGLLSFRKKFLCKP